MKQQHLARRQPERRELMRVLDSKRPGLVIIRGSTGLGKTALMLDVLASRRHVYFRNVPITGIRTSVFHHSPTLRAELPRRSSAWRST